MSVPLPPDEAQRLDALHRCAILDTPPDAVFDRIAHLAARLLRTPIALISLIAEDRQWFKARVGLDLQEIPRSEAFCAHTILSDAPLVVPDARLDLRFRENPLVTGPSGFRFYAGVPVKSKDGFNVGTLSAIDVVPRILSEGDLATLQELAAMVTDEVYRRLEVLELQRRQREREESENLKEMVFAATDLGISITDQRGIFVDVNPAYCRIFGYEPEELIGKPFAIMLHSKDFRRAERIHAAFFKRWMASAGEWEARRKDDTVIRVYLTARRFERHDGETFAVTTVTDITGLRRMQDVLQHRHKMDAVGRLAGGVAHDFNNLLTIILGYGQVLMDQLGTHPASDTAGEILKAAGRASGLTRQLLDLSRQQPLRVEPVNLNAVLRELEDMLRRLIEEHITLTIHSEPNLPDIDANRIQVEQIVLTLVSNARDAMGGGGDLVIRTGVEHIAGGRTDSPELAPGHYVTLTVTDTGHGMSPEVRARMFEPFFTTKPPGEGAGLGLATLYANVKRFGGGVTVRSRAGQGATFRLYFPRAGALPEAEAAAGTAGCAGRPLTILITEDEPALRALVAQMLAARGHTVIEAENARQAMEIWDRRQDIDVLLTDVIMPDVNGYELAGHISRRGRQAKVLFISGYSENMLERGNLPGIRSDFLQKPFTAEQLTNALARLCQSGPTAT